MNGDTTVIKRDTVDGMIDAYNTARVEVHQAIDLLRQAKARMGAAFGESRDTILPHNFNDYALTDAQSRSDKIMLKNAWYSVSERVGIRSLMSIAARNKFDDQLERGELPELTAEHVWSFVEGLGHQLGSLLEDSAREVFHWLRPARSTYKTNTEFEIGRKVVLGWIVENWTGGRSHVMYRVEQHIVALDNVFHLLDAKGPVKHPGDFLTTIRTAMDSGQWQCVTPYFRAKWFKNHNMHIKFLRPDLVDRLNAMAGGKNLKPDHKETPCNETRMTVG